MDKKTNSVRINAGCWRSRVLKFPDAEGLRPTPDRVRQTVFNWLGQDLTGLHCLDLFAGTGVMGFESSSRGAKSVTLVENNRQVFNALKENQALLKASNLTLFNGDAQQFLQTNLQSNLKNSLQLFDVVFCDPPYAQGLLNTILPALVPHLAPSAYVYAEAEYSIEPDAVWNVHKHGKAGNVYYHLLKSANDDES